MRSVPSTEIPQGKEVLERITDAGCGGHGEGVVISDVYRHNACNQTYTGHIEYREKRSTSSFIAETGMEQM